MNAMKIRLGPRHRPGFQARNAGSWRAGWNEPAPTAVPPFGGSHRYAGALRQSVAARPIREARAVGRFPRSPPRKPLPVQLRQRQRSSTRSPWSLIRGPPAIKAAAAAPRVSVVTVSPPLSSGLRQCARPDELSLLTTSTAQLSGQCPIMAVPCLLPGMCVPRARYGSLPGACRTPSHQSPPSAL